MDDNRTRALLDAVNAVATTLVDGSIDHADPHLTVAARLALRAAADSRAGDELPINRALILLAELRADLGGQGYGITV